MSSSAGLLASSSRRSLPGVSLAAGKSSDSQDDAGGEKSSRKQQREERAAKRKLEEKKDSKHDKKGATVSLPGSKKEMCTWEEGCSEPTLVFGVDVFKVGAYAAHIGLKPSSSNGDKVAATEATASRTKAMSLSAPTQRGGEPSSKVARAARAAT